MSVHGKEESMIDLFVLTLDFVATVGAPAAASPTSTDLVHVDGRSADRQLRPAS